MSKNCINCIVSPRDGGDLLCTDCRNEERLKHGLEPLPQGPPPFAPHDDGDIPPKTEGGYVWCDNCGYNATLSELQFRMLANGHDTWCKDCAEYGMDAMLAFDRTFPDHVIPDDPMKAHEQTYPSSRI